jgi:RNA polymerase sigma-70 factor (ECF subfamily)
MAIINLRDYYPFYKNDFIIEVPDDVAKALHELDRLEDTYQRRSYRHKAHYSLDRNDGIEHDILFVSLSPYEIYERKDTYEQVYAAISSLPNKQAKRIYAYYFLGMSMAAIAKAEGINKSQVTKSIRRALSNMEQYLKNIL